MAPAIKLKNFDTSRGGYKQEYNISLDVYGLDANLKAQFEDFFINPQNKSLLRL